MIDKSISFGGANAKLAPLMSFNTIVDIDFGLINLIYDKYLDESVFDIEFFNQNPIDIIHELYNRKDKNPLKIIAKDNISKDKLDIYYKEFIETKMQDIFEYSITTDMLNLIDSFNKSQAITPIIFCYSKDQIEILNKEPKLAPNEKIIIKSLTEKDLIAYKQFFVKDLDEVRQFSNCLYKAFYISTFRPNFNENGEDFRDDELIMKIINNGNNIGVFDIYKNIN